MPRFSGKGGLRVFGERIGGSSSVVVVKCRSGDIPELAAVLQVCPEAAGWPEKSLEEAFQSQPGAILLARENERLVGFVVGRQAAEEVEILNLAVRPEARRRGVGKALVLALLRALGGECQGKVFLEVRESNAAGIAFYRSLGFEQIGRRGEYYCNPSEAAVVLCLNAPRPASGAM
jgi:[ribosomal protein S18]-alanine N-acetyltransferase